MFIRDLFKDVIKMQIIKIPILSAILTISIIAAKPPENIYLSLDYTQEETWKYSFEYNSERKVIEKESNSFASTQISFNMNGKIVNVYEGQRILFNISDVKVSSRLFGQDEQKEIKKKLSGADFSLAIIGGCPVVDTLRSFQVGEISQWDLVIQFAKLLPDIPRQPVKKRYSWESSGVFPIMTHRGEIPCDVYRLYKIDSLPQEGNLAYISWEFRYAATEKTVQQYSALQKMPISGKGSGMAVIDNKNKLIREASVKFETPVVVEKNKKITWVEKTTLKYLPPPQEN